MHCMQNIANYLTMVYNKGCKMDKMTNGFVKIPKGQEADVQLNIKWHFEDLVLKEYGVKAKAKVKLIPIEEVITKKKDRLNFTHAYQVRIRG